MDESAAKKRTKIEQSTVSRRSRRVSVRFQREFAGPRPRVLLVDDDDQMRRSLSRLLWGDCEVHTASDARQAAAMLGLGRFDAVVTDYDMPGESGVWLLERVEQGCPRTKRILVSGTDPTELKGQLSNTAVEFFFPKPADKNAILSSLYE